MYTLCPKCDLTLVVSATDLRVGQGYVRCGRCLTVFGALATLSDERPVPPDEEVEEDKAPDAQSTQEGASAERTAAAAGAPDSNPGNVVVTDANDGDMALDEASEAAAAIEAAGSEGIEVVESLPAESIGTGTFQTIVLSGEAIAIFEDAGEPEDIAQTVHPVEDLPQDKSRTSSDALPVKDAARAPQEDASGLTHLEPAEYEGLPQDLAIEDAATPAWLKALAGQKEKVAPRWQSVAADAGTVVLVLLLIAQVVHHYRNQLALTAPFSWMLPGLYKAIGAPLVPEWDLKAYDVRQLGAAAGTADTPGQREVVDSLVVRATVANKARHAQPLPLLRVVVQDRYGNPVAAREVSAAAYAPRLAAANSLLAPGERIDTEILFLDPGANAVGFELDACLRRAHGRVVCAGEH